MDELLQAHAENKEETRFYEVGYHLVPTIAAEMVAEAAGKIKDRVAAHGGALMGEEMPKKVELAYPLPRLIGNTRAFFDSAYFGWVRFEMPQENIAVFDREMKENESVIRFLIIHVKPEKVVQSVRKMPFFAGVKAAPVKGSAGEAKGEERHPMLSEAEMDKTIEELIAE